jgi:cell division septation protein DedD
MVMKPTSEVVEGARPSPRRQKYRDLPSGVVVIVVLVTTIAGTTTWQIGQLSCSWLSRASFWENSRALVVGCATPRPQAAHDTARVAGSGAVGNAVTIVTAERAFALSAEVATPAASAAEAAPAKAEVSEKPTRTSRRDMPLIQNARFAVEFSPFLSSAEAEDAERHINRAGYQTVRFRQRTGAALYGVLVEELPGAREAQALLSQLAEQRFPEALIVSNNEMLMVRVGDPQLLHGAVELGKRLRAKGYQVRVTAQPGTVETFVIRHGNFASREHAEARGSELRGLGIPSYVVRAK